MSSETSFKMKRMDLNASPNEVNGPGYHILAEQAVSFEKTYIQDLAAKVMGEELKCAVATSNCVSEVYSLINNQFKPLATLKGHTSSVTNIRFSHESDHLVYTSSLDGKIKVWDLRTSDCVREMKDNVKPLSCMDISSNDRLLCAGTELVDGDAFLLFWDIRSRKLLGGYWESHTDDITSVSFHPGESDTVASGSTDGLINVFDLRESCEDDALQTSLNTESSIARTRWHSNDQLSVVTHTETVQLWDRNGSAPNENWNRESLANAMSTSHDDCYIVDVYSNSENDMFTLTGSHSGKGEKLQLLSFGDSKLTPGLPFIGNRQTIRSSQYIEENNLFITGGENGYLCVWKASSDKVNQMSKKQAKTRSKPKHKPY